VHVQKLPTLRCEATKQAGDTSGQGSHQGACRGRKGSRVNDKGRAPGTDISNKGWHKQSVSHHFTADLKPCSSCGADTYYRVHFPWGGMDQWFCEQCGKKHAAELSSADNPT